MYYIYGISWPSLLIESTDLYDILGKFGRSGIMVKIPSWKVIANLYRSHCYSNAMYLI